MGNLNINTTDNQINITPTDTQVRIYSGGFATPGGDNTEIQYNDNGRLNGAANITYTNGAMFISNNNFKITGGNNGYFLQTDGNGNLTWYPGTAFPTGNGTVGGANTQIQYNNAGNFGGISGFTVNNLNNNISMPNNLSVVSNINVARITATGNVTANYFIGNGAFLTGIDASKIQNGNSNVSVAANSNVTVSVNGVSNVATFTNNSLTVNGNVTANYFIGDVIGSAQTVTINAQPNITSVGILTSLAVNGTTSIYQGIENVSLISPQVGNYNYDLLNGAIQYSTGNATGNVLLNFRGNSTTTANSILANGKSITSTYILTNGSTAYGITGLQIDGSNTNVRWSSNIIPISASNTTQSYTFTIIKTSTTPTYVIFGNMTRYG